MNNLPDPIILLVYFVLLGVLAVLYIRDWLEEQKQLAEVERQLQRLEDSRPKVRELAAKALGTLKKSRAATGLMRALTDSSPAVRKAVINALGDVRAVASCRTLIYIALHDNNSDARGAAVRAMGKIGEYLTKSRLVMVSVESDQSDENLKAFDFLEDYIEPGLLLALRDENVDVRKIAVSATQSFAKTRRSVMFAQLFAEFASNISGVSPESIEDQNSKVQFSAYYPEEVETKTQHHLYIYAHTEDEFRAAKSDFEILRRALVKKVWKLKKAKQRTKLGIGIKLTVKPESAEVEFQPDSLTQAWDGDWIRFDFKFTPNEKLGGKPISARISVQVNGIEIAHIKFSFEVIQKQPERKSNKFGISNPLAAARLASQTTEIYKRIFISYSRADKEVVEAYRFAQLALGNEVFMDTYSIRAGEDWRAALARGIDQADILQLFWSKNSSVSPSVHDEWEYALNYKCPDTLCEGFIRPIYWKQPLPTPPKELSHLNFRYVPIKLLGERKVGSSN